MAITTEVALRPWLAGDLWLMERLMGDPAMTEHLGGPESPEKIQSRHARYMGVGDTSTGQMYVVVVGPQRAAAGSVGYWDLDWQGEVVWETGWGVLPEFQGQGIASRATILAVDRARTDGTHRSIDAFPKVDNGPSNGVCRKAGFTLVGECDLEYPPGNPIRCHDWAIDLTDTGSPGIVSA